MNRSLLCALVLALPACAQGEPQKTPPPDGKDLLAGMLKLFTEQGIVYDDKAQTVTITCTVNGPPDPIEYLLIHERGKRHEAVLITKSKPSVLNAALLVLGLQPGKNATYREKDPPPTQAEFEKGADPVIVVPPQGMNFWMTVKWQDQDGKAHEHCIEELVLDIAAGKALATADWVFLGGRMARLYKNDPEVYVADYEGNIISTCYMAPDNHLATLRHERARDEHNWWITDVCPPPGTQLQLTFWKQKPKLVQERETALQKEAEAAKQAGGKDEAAKAAEKK
ncbi:MAG TPA: YdjY domain-containing protein [Planctomycetota bacterium]|nr:YdjY domain-containing protein [Planctomycetota bacterium]